MIENAVLVSYRAGVDAVPLLRRVAQAAQQELLATRRDLDSVQRVLAAILAALAPVERELEAMGSAEPTSAVAAVLGHLRMAFTHAAEGRADPAVSSVVTAAATSYRLADDAALDAEASRDRMADLARWL